MKANKVFNQTAPVMDNLYERWQDEQQYEEWKDYAQVLKKSVQDAGGVFVKATNQPFEVVFKSAGEGTFKIKVNGGNIKLYSIKE